MDRGKTYPILHQFSRDRSNFILKENKIAHHHCLLAHSLKADPGSESQSWFYHNLPNLYRKVTAWKGDFVHLTLHGPFSTQNLLNAIPSSGLRINRGDIPKY